MNLFLYIKIYLRQGFIWNILQEISVLQLCVLDIITKERVLLPVYHEFLTFLLTI